MHKKTSVLLIGSGRLASHLEYWNTLQPNPVNLYLWNRNQDISLLNKHINICQIVWLAISDSAILSFYEKYLSGFNLQVVHFSGALNDSRLACAHPLMSFSSKLFDKGIYEKIHFVINGTSHLNSVLPDFKNTFTLLDTEKKSLYHALCVLSGNFPQLLWNEVETNMLSLGLPKEAFEIYIQQITNNYLNYKELAITGPLVRNDLATIEKNLSSLNELPNLKNIYQVFQKEFTK